MSVKKENHEKINYSLHVQAIQYCGYNDSIAIQYMKLLERLLNLLTRNGTPE